MNYTALGAAHLGPSLWLQGRLGFFRDNFLLSGSVCRGEFNPGVSPRLSVGDWLYLMNQPSFLCLLMDSKVNVGLQTCDLSSCRVMQNAWGLDKGKLICLHLWEIVLGFPCNNIPPGAQQGLLNDTNKLASNWLFICTEHFSLFFIWNVPNYTESCNYSFFFFFFFFGPDMFCNERVLRALPLREKYCYSWLW